MSLRRLVFLQWFGIGAGAVVWITSFLAGTGISQADCNPGSGRWGIPHDLVEGTLTGVALLLILLAEAAAIAVYRATRGVEEQGPPPHARLHFFASAAMLSNVLFFMIILISGIATIVDRLCQSA